MLGLLRFPPHLQLLPPLRSWTIQSPMSATKRWAWGPAAHHSKANKEARLVEREVCFISDAGNWEWRVRTPVQSPTSPLPLTVGAFIDRVLVVVGGVTCRNSAVISKVVFRLVLSGLTSITLVVLGAVNLQFWGALVPLSLRPILGTVAAEVVWPSCSSLLHLMF